MKKQYIRYDTEEEPIVMSKSLLDMLLKQKRPSNLIALYSFYYYTAKWQKTNQPRATNTYTSKALEWSENKLVNVKKRLVELGLIENIVIKDTDTSRILGHYIKVNFIWSKNTPQTTEIPGYGKMKTNALSAVKKDISSKLIKFSKKFLKRQQKNWPKLIPSIDKPKVLSNAAVLDKLIRIDGFNFEEDIKPALEYAIDNDFWSRNLLSLASLRNKSKANGETKFINLLASCTTHVVKVTKTELKISTMIKKRYEFYSKKEVTSQRDLNVIRSLAIGIVKFYKTMRRSDEQIEDSLHYYFPDLTIFYKRYLAFLESKLEQKVFPINYFKRDGALWKEFIRQQSENVGIDLETGKVCD